MATFNDYETGQYMTEGIYFCKITDIEHYYNGRNQCVRVRFCDGRSVHVENYYINKKAIFKLIVLFNDIGLTREEKDDIDIKDLAHPELSIENICDFCKEYIMTRLVKIQLEPSKHNPQFCTITKIRNLKDDEKATYIHLVQVISEFPKLYDDETGEANMNRSFETETSQISDEDEPFWKQQKD